MGFILLLMYFIFWTNVEGLVRKEHIILENAIEHETIMLPEDYQNLANFKLVDLKTVPGISVHDDPLLSARKFEGDIANITIRTIHKFINDSNNLGRAAVKDKWRLWPKKEIPYTLSSLYGSYSRQVILKAFDEYHRKTCLRFVPRTTQSDYVYIRPDDGCYSLVGRVGGQQTVSLDAGCIQVGTVIHELMHSAGFFHEQSRTDRDDNIEIMWDNIDSDAIDQFEKYGLRTITLLGLPYDYGSIMHYGSKAFTKNGAPTIKALKNGGDKMGQRDGFSSLDLKKFNKLYDCDDTDTSTDTSVTTRGGLIISNRRKTTLRPSVKCVDNKWQCFFWKTFGYCETDRTRMLEMCPKRCNFCDELASGGGAIQSNIQPDDDPNESAPPAPTISSNNPEGTAAIECENKNGHCDRWSSMGYCDREGFSAFVVENCPKSCRTCADQSNQPRMGRDNGIDCKDTTTKCSTLAAVNMCRGQNEQFMRTYCKKSCGLCSTRRQ